MCFHSKLTLNDGSIAQTSLHALPGRQVFLLVNDHDGRRALVLVGGGIIILGDLSIGQIPHGLVDALVDAARFAGIEQLRPGLRDGTEEGAGGIARLVQEFVGGVVTTGCRIFGDFFSVLGLGAVYGVAKGVSAAAGLLRLCIRRFFVIICGRGIRFAIFIVGSCREISLLDTRKSCTWSGKGACSLYMVLLAHQLHWKAARAAVASCSIVSSITYAGRRVPCHRSRGDDRTG